jgi:hypothetical protein
MSDPPEENIAERTQRIARDQNISLREAERIAFAEVRIEKKRAGSKHA